MFYDGLALHFNTVIEDLCVKSFIRNKSGQEYLKNPKRTPIIYHVYGIGVNLTKRVNAKVNMIYNSIGRLAPKI